jgi:hypothetical protein
MILSIAAARCSSVVDQSTETQFAAELQLLRSQIKFPRAKALGMQVQLPVSKFRRSFTGNILLRSTETKLMPFASLLPMALPTARLSL